MKQWNRGLYIGTILILIVLFLISYINLSAFQKPDRIYNISVIIDEKEDTYWKNIQKGMEQAALEYQADLNFITLYDDKSTLQQLELLKRETENGADAVIISPANNKALAKGFDNMMIKVPVVLIDSGIMSTKVNAVVAPDNLTMGQNIGREVLKDTQKDNILIITDVLTSTDIIDRYNGVVSVLESNNIKYHAEEFSDKEAVESYTQGLVNKRESYVVIALEEKYLLWIAESMKEHSVSPLLRLYGIGSNNQIISLLENRMIQSIVAPDNYDIGYFSVQEAIESVQDKNRRSEIIIDSLIVHPETIYNKENEKRLFPI